MTLLQPLRVTDTLPRPDKDTYYMDMAQATAQRATCLRRRYGAVIVNDDQVVGTGYCGAPRGAGNCIDTGVCKREEAGAKPGERYELCVSVHAEMNAVIHAGRGRCIGGTIYVYGFDAKTGEQVNSMPCLLCRRVIVNAGIKWVGYWDGAEYQMIATGRWISQGLV